MPTRFLAMTVLVLSVTKFCQKGNVIIILSLLLLFQEVGIVIVFRSIYWEMTPILGHVYSGHSAEVIYVHCTEFNPEVSFAFHSSHAVSLSSVQYLVICGTYNVSLGFDITSFSMASLMKLVEINPNDEWVNVRSLLDRTFVLSSSFLSSLLSLYIIHIKKWCAIVLDVCSPLQMAMAGVTPQICILNIADDINCYLVYKTGCVKHVNNHRLS